MTTVTQLEFAKESLEAMLLTDEELEKLIAFLQSKITVSTLSKDILKSIKGEWKEILMRDEIIPFSSVQSLKEFLSQDEMVEPYHFYHGANGMDSVNYTWIFEELQHAQKNDK